MMIYVDFIIDVLVCIWGCMGESICIFLRLVAYDDLLIFFIDICDCMLTSSLRARTDVYFYV
jgi:hypothetical protein